MSDKSGESKQKAEEKPITDKDLEDISGGIIIQRTPTATTVPIDTSQSLCDAHPWQNPPDDKT